MAAVARACARLRGNGILSLASWLLAQQLAFGLGAESGLLAFPIAFGLLAKGEASWLGSDAGCAALGWATNGLALRAIVLLAHILGAAHAALRSLALNGAFSGLQLFTLHLAFGASANGVALSRAHGIVTLPPAFRVARRYTSFLGVCPDESRHQHAETDSDASHL